MPSHQPSPRTPTSSAPIPSASTATAPAATATATAPAPVDPPAAVPRAPAASAAGAPTAPDPVPPRPDALRIGLFLLLALTVSTALALPFATGLLPAEAVGLVVPLAQLSPLAAALLVRRRVGRWYRDLALTVPSWRALAWTAAALVAAFALVPVLRVLLGLALGAPVAADLPVLSLALAVPMVWLVQSLFAIGEEAGWRGWLHRELAPLGFWPAAMLTGAMWALWHLPIVLALGLEGREAIGYLATIVAVAPLLAAARELSGTAWAAVIGHGLLSSLRVAIDQNVLGALDPATAWTLEIVSWALWIAVAWAVLRLVGPLRRP
jgi:membrane protease YdiL (CAAX protease family)